MARLSPYRLFYWFCAVLYPVLAAGAVAVAGFRAWWLAAFTVVLLVAWVWHSFATTCRRCQFYGTNKCGIPGLVVPYFYSKRATSELPTWRIWANYYADLLLMAYLNAIYGFAPALLPLSLPATAVVWLVVYRRKRFHGLMHVLEKRARVIPINAI